MKRDGKVLEMSSLIRSRLDSLSATDTASATNNTFRIRWEVAEWGCGGSRVGVWEQQSGGVGAAEWGSGGVLPLSLSLTELVSL